MNTAWKPSSIFCLDTVINVHRTLIDNRMTSRDDLPRRSTVLHLARSSKKAMSLVKTKTLLGDAYHRRQRHKSRAAIFSAAAISRRVSFSAYDGKASFSIDIWIQLVTFSSSRVCVCCVCLLLRRESNDRLQLCGDLCFSMEMQNAVNEEGDFF